MLEDFELNELTTRQKKLAIARYIEGLGCAVFAEGKELPPWAGHKADQLIGATIVDGAILTNDTEISYFTFEWNSDSDDLRNAHGPLKATDLKQM